MQSNSYPNITFRVITPEGKGYIIITEKEVGKVEDVFIIVGKSGGPLRALCQALEISAKLALINTHILKYSYALRNIVNDLPQNRNHTDKSIPAALSRVLEEYYRLNHPDVRIGEERITSFRGRK